MEEFTLNKVSMSGIDVRDKSRHTFCVKERAIKKFLGVIAEFAGVFRDRLGPVVLGHGL